MIERFKVGDTIEVIDQEVYPFLVRGKIINLDVHPLYPLANSFAKIELYSAALPVPIQWVNLRNARIV